MISVVRYTALLLTLPASACSGGSSSPVSEPSRSQTYALTAGTYALPESNGYSCTMTLPANNATAGTITVTMPPPGTQAITYVPVAVGLPVGNTYSTTYPNPAQIVATTSVAVVFQGVPAATCSLTGSTSSGISFVDPADPGAIYGPSIVVTTGTGGQSTVSVPAGIRFPIGSI